MIENQAPRHQVSLQSSSTHDISSRVFGVMEERSIDDDGEEFFRKSLNIRHFSTRRRSESRLDLKLFFCLTDVCQQKFVCCLADMSRSLTDEWVELPSERKRRMGCT
jgi:hypothetical protein